MKKLLAILLALMLCLSFIACSSGDPKTITADDDDDKKQEEKEEKEEEKEDDISDEDAYKKEVHAFLYEMSEGEAEYGVCAECGDEIGEDYVLCDDCITADSGDVCLYCQEDLDGDYVLHKDCFEDFKDLMEGLSEDYDDTDDLWDDDEAELDEAVSSEYDNCLDCDAVIPMSDWRCEDCAAKVTCDTCGGPLATDDYSTCWDCLLAN
ncbi:MAG: hypothetical protein E7591_03270 [Ruminococcaceae bacterium]|nr:hypothetical protein [Oscillospiraceae bacterium]